MGGEGASPRALNVCNSNTELDRASTNFLEIHTRDGLLVGIGE